MIHVVGKTNILNITADQTNHQHEQKFKDIKHKLIIKLPLLGTGTFCGK